MIGIYIYEYLSKIEKKSIILCINDNKLNMFNTL